MLEKHIMIIFIVLSSSSFRFIRYSLSCRRINESIGKVIQGQISRIVKMTKKFYLKNITLVS